MTHPYHENTIHGTPVFHLQVYSHCDKEGFYFVSQHWHEELEWIYVEYGTLHITVHGKLIILHTGEYCFINTGELHEIKSMGASLHHAIVFHAHFLDFALYDVCQHYFIRPITNGNLLFKNCFCEYSPQHSKQIIFHMQEIITLYHASTDCASLSIKIHILHILELLFQYHYFLKNTSFSKKEDSLNKLKQVIEYIHNNITNTISLQTLSEICFMSSNYFCHYFKKEIGKTPISFINEYRIEKACEMLSECNLPISNIALSVGFDNFSYFIRKFREYKGITPKEYRLLCKK